MKKNEKINDLSVYDRVKFARNPYRPNYEDLIINIFDQFVELHGDRISRDDHAVLTGMASVNGMNAIVVMTAKGKDIKERKYRNFGMVSPDGYRKVMRVAMLGEKLKLPILVFIDTPGANYGIESERMGQSSEIAHCIKYFMNIRTPVISISTGEGGSGGALALGVADKIFIMENAIYSVISPEGCASINKFRSQGIYSE